MKVNKLFNVPILFIIFRRKNTALKVIDAISKVKPEKLYISQDGPRNKKEVKELDETREAVLSKINWECKLIVWTHDKNLGLKKHIPEAFDRFFSNEESGIYLEDDTLPSSDFFYFQKEMLEKYKDDNRIFSINGTNFYPDIVKAKESYYLSKIGDIWGFGIWRRSWKLYDTRMKDLKHFSDQKDYKNRFFSSKYQFYLESFWTAIKKRKIDSWAMQIIFAALKNDMYFITPNVNLVNNIGTNIASSNISLQRYYSNFGNILPLSHPQKLIYDKRLDIIYFNNMLKGGWLRLVLNKLYLMLPYNLRLAVGSIVNRIYKYV